MKQACQKVEPELDQTFLSQLFSGKIQNMRDREIHSSTLYKKCCAGTGLHHTFPGTL